jgi:hypothetical protein
VDVFKFLIAGKYFTRAWFSTAMAETAEEVDIKALQGKQDKIKELMRRDPKFIARLISVRITSDTCKFLTLSAT